MQPLISNPGLIPQCYVIIPAMQGPEQMMRGLIRVLSPLLPNHSLPHHLPLKKRSRSLPVLGSVWYALLRRYNIAFGIIWEVAVCHMVPMQHHTCTHAAITELPTSKSNTLAHAQEACAAHALLQDKFASHQAAVCHKGVRV